MAANTAVRPQPSLAWNLWWLLPFAFALWFKEFSPMERTATPTLDESWHFIKGMELLHGTQVGVESIFTYGRLGWFYVSSYIPELWNWKLWGFEILFKGILVLFCVRAVWLTPGGLTRILFALSLLVVPAGFDGFAFVAMVALWRFLLEPGRRSWPLESLALALLVLIAMVKFTYALVFFLALLVIAAALWRSDSRNRAVGFLLRSAAIFWLIWFLLGQSILNLPAYIRTSWWVTQGYNDGMSLNGPFSELLLAWFLLAVAIVMVTILCWRERTNPRVLAMGVLVLLGAGMAYKAGFTRHMGNAMILFAVVPSASFFTLGMVQDLRAPLRWLVTAGRAGTLAACAMGYLHTIQLYRYGPIFYVYSYKDLCIGRWKVLTDLEGLRERLAVADRRVRDHFRLPSIVERVGKERVDVFDFGQSIAMLNGLNYAPRPVFQSYKTYMPELARINSAYYSGSEAPRFVMYQNGTIDQRMPMASEGDTLELLLRRYKPVFIERGWLLLERSDDPARPVREETVLETTGRFGEWVEIGALEGEGLRVAADLQPTLIGKAWTFLVRGALVWGEFELDNQVRVNYRIVPRSLRAGTLLRPHIGSQMDVERMFSGTAPLGVRRFRIVIDPRFANQFKPEFSVRVSRVEGLVPPPTRIETRELDTGGFDPKPDEIAATPIANRVPYRGIEVTLAPAPSTVRWKLQGGKYRINGFFGLLDDSWASGCTDGANFVVLTRDAAGTVREWKRYELVPGMRESDREQQTLEAVVEISGPFELFLRTTNGAAGNPACDWTYWGGVRVERIE